MNEELNTGIEVPQPPGPLTVFTGIAKAELAARNAYHETLNSERRTRTVYLVTQMEHSEERDAYRDNPMFEAGRLAIFDACYNTRRAYEVMTEAIHLCDELYAAALIKAEEN
jgi:hypothetical protein